MNNHDFNFDKMTACNDDLPNSLPNDKQVIHDGELSDDDIAKVINPKRLAELLQQANAFNFVHSEELDNF